MRHHGRAEQSASRLRARRHDARPAATLLRALARALTCRLHLSPPPVSPSAGEPKMIYLVSSLTITQTIITDCSFVSSLVIAAAYERKFRKQLITKILYPQAPRTHCTCMCLCPVSYTHLTLPTKRIV